MSLALILEKDLKLSFVSIWILSAYSAPGLASGLFLLLLFASLRICRTASKGIAVVTCEPKVNVVGSPAFFGHWIDHGPRLSKPLIVTLQSLLAHGAQPCCRRRLI